MGRWKPVLEKHRMAHRHLISRARRHVKHGYRKFLQDNNVDDANVIFDIGANIGVVAITFATYVPYAKVYAFEPVEDNYSFLCKNIHNNPKVTDRIEPFNVGFWSEEKELPIGFPVHRDDTDNTGLYSVFGFKQQTKAKFITMDSWCAAHNVYPDFIKIDAEGSEREILVGGQKALDHARHITYEVNLDYLKQIEGIEDILKSKGFREIPEMKLKSDVFWSKV
tara:strand:- start:141 stop:809 length:669 start_codon:yes stop_codon:yes gene_type:complete